MTCAEPGQGEQVRTTAAMPDGTEVKGDACFRVDRSAQRIQWGVAGPRRVLWAPAGPSGRAGQRGASYENDDRPAGSPLPTSRVAGPSAALALGYGPTSRSCRDVLRGKLRLAKGPPGAWCFSRVPRRAGPTRPGDINCLVSGVRRCWYR